MRNEAEIAEFITLLYEEASDKGLTEAASFLKEAFSMLVTEVAADEEKAETEETMAFVYLLH